MSSFHLRWDLVRVFCSALSSSLHPTAMADDDGVEHAPLFDEADVVKTTIEQLLKADAEKTLSTDKGYVIFLRLLAVDPLVHSSRSPRFKHRLHLAVQSLDPTNHLRPVSDVDHDILLFNAFATNVYHNIEEMKLRDEPQRVGLVVYWPKGELPYVLRPTLPYRRDLEERCLLYVGTEIKKSDGSNELVGIYISPEESSEIDADTQLSLSVIPDSQPQSTPFASSAKNDAPANSTRDDAQSEVNSGQEEGQAEDQAVSNDIVGDGHQVQSLPEAANVGPVASTSKNISPSVKSTEKVRKDDETNGSGSQSVSKKSPKPVATVVPHQHRSLSRVGYKRLNECTAVGNQNKYFVWAVINKVARETSLTRTGKYMATLYIRDEDYQGSFDHSDYQFSILGDNPNLFPPLNEDDVIRIHHMVVQWWQEELTGRVFSGASVTVIPGKVDDPIIPICKQNSATFQFTAEDEARVLELRHWWQKEKEKRLQQAQDNEDGDARSRTSKEVKISEIDVPGTFDFFCRVIKTTSTMITVTDGTTPNPCLITDCTTEENEVPIFLELESQEAESSNNMVDISKVTQGKYVVAVEVESIEQEGLGEQKLRLVMRNHQKSHFIPLTDDHSRAREISKRIEQLKSNKVSASQGVSSALMDSVMERVRLLHEGVNPEQVYQLHPENKNKVAGEGKSKGDDNEKKTDKEQNKNRKKNKKRKKNADEDGQKETQKEASGPITRQRKRALQSPEAAHVVMKRLSNDDLRKWRVEAEDMFNRSFLEESRDDESNDEGADVNQSSIKIQRFTQLRMEVDLNSSSSSEDDDLDLEYSTPNEESGDDNGDDDDNFATCPDTLTTKN